MPSSNAFFKASKVNDELLSKTSFSTSECIDESPKRYLPSIGEFMFNYYGTIGTNRDEFVIVRKMKKVDWLDESQPAALEGVHS